MLLPLSFDEMKSKGDKMWKEALSIKFNAQRLAWYMRGGIDFVDIMNMSLDEIDHINKIIDENMDVTKKTKIPFF